MNKKFHILLISLTFLFTSASCDKMGRKKTTPGPKDTIHSVSVSPVQEREVPNVLQLAGQFIPTTRLEVKSDYNGKVQALSVNEGQNVYTGEVLLKIEDEKLPFVLDRQRAELREAEAKMELDERLASGNGSQDALDEEIEEDEDLEIAEEPEERDEENEYEEEGVDEAQRQRIQRLAQLRKRLQQRRSQQARGGPPGAPQESPEIRESRGLFNQAKIDRIKTEIALSEKQISGSTLAAPFDGFISEVKTAEGALIKPGDLLLKMIAIDPIELSLRIPKSKIAQVDKRAKVKVKAPDVGLAPFQGEISFIGAEIDTLKNTLEIRVRVNNPDIKIKGGMEGVAELPMTGKASKALVVPEAAIVRDKDQAYVYVVDGALAIKQKVDTGGFIQGMIEIKDGLKKTDRVVTRGLDQFKEDEEFVKF